MKKIFVLLMLIMLSMPIFAQDETVETPTTYRSLLFYLDSFSGHLTKSPTGNNRLFGGNEFEFGMTYSQNFAAVPWLSMWAKALVATGTGASYDPVSDAFNGYESTIFIQPYANPRAQLGINLGGYTIFAIDTRGLLANENYYNFNFGNAGSLLLYTTLEMFLFPIRNGEIQNGKPYGQVLDLFQLGINYSVSFAERWTFVSKFGFRFGAGGANPLTGLGADTSALAFAESFHLRWENQLIVSVTRSFYMWTQLRLNVNNLANDAPVDNQLFLQAGLGYTFDFSKN